MSAFVTTATINQPSYAGSTKFFCKQINDTPVTMVRTSRGNEPMIRWVVKDFTRSGFNPLQRCQAVSQRFQRYYDNGRLYMTSRDNLNGYPVLCIAKSIGGSCSGQDILITLKKGTDPGTVLEQIYALRSSANSQPILLSGSKYVSYVNGDWYLDVKQLVDTPFQP
ncbi:MAG: COP23 domain-containing protein [Gloeotrichia echinulata HAB0833]